MIDDPVIVGVDEAGCGPLAGPVIAAAVILNANKPIMGLADSKLLSAIRRTYLADQIREHALATSIGRADVFEIDKINILQASLLAMQRAVSGLSIQPDLALIDGRHSPALVCAVRTIIRGDRFVAVISAASIIAKVYRDAEMLRWDEQYPGYGFAQHKGYPTRAHLQALKKLGVTPLHRRSFAPVKQIIQKETLF